MTHPVSTTLHISAVRGVAALSPRPKHQLLDELRSRDTRVIRDEAGGSLAPPPWHAREAKRLNLELAVRPHTTA